MSSNFQISGQSTVPGSNIGVCFKSNVLTVAAFQRNARIVDHQKNVQIVHGKNVVAMMRLRMADNLEQYIVIGAIVAAVAIFLGTRIFLVFRK